MSSKNVSYGTTSRQTRLVDLSNLDNLVGHGTADPHEEQRPFPGVNGAGPIIHGIAPGEVIAMRFRPAGVLQVSVELPPWSQNNKSPVDLCFSKHAGDFVGDPGDKGCCALRQYPGTGWIGGRTIQPDNPAYAFLTPDEDWYLNLRLSASATAGVPAIDLWMIWHYIRS
jgi:hypothetical protein